MNSQNENGNVTIVTQAKIKINKEKQFIEWQKKLNKELEEFKGFLAQTIISPNPLSQDWIFMQRFATLQEAKSWLNSKEKKDLINEIKSSLQQEDIVYISHDLQPIKSNLATMIAAYYVKPTMQDQFINWQNEVKQNLFSFEGFLDVKLIEPISGVNESWITVIEFDSDKHLQNWLDSTDYEKIIKQSNLFTTKSILKQIHTGYNFWFNKSCYSNAIWKQNMLILLALYPTVFLYTYFIQLPIVEKRIPFYLSLFISNAISTFFLGYFALPALGNIFKWWLNPNYKYKIIINIIGFAFIILLYIFTIWLFSLIHWTWK